MGTSATENIALSIESSADTQAVLSAADDVTSLGKAAKDATEQASSGFQAASANAQKFGATLQHSEEGVERTRGAARGLALEASHLSEALVLGQGSMMGLVRAAGLMSTELAEVSGSAELAASASGIGAIVTVIATVIGLFAEANSESDKFKGNMNDLAGLSSSALAIQEQAVRTEIDSLQGKMATNMQLLFSPNWAQLNNNNAQYLKLEQDAYDRLNEILKAETEARSREGEQQLRDQERRAAEAERIAEENARKAASLDATMTEERQSALDKATLSEEDQAIQKVLRDEQRREQEIRDLQVSEDEKTKLLLLAQANRDAQIAAIHKGATDRQDKEDQRAADEANRKSQQAIDQKIHSLESVADAAIRSGDSYMQVVTKTLLTPLEKELESIAASELVKAGKDAASLNFAGAAAHAAVGALALEGARKVAQIGGLNSSGGGGGSSYGSGGGFTPNAPAAAASTTVNLITTDPYGRQNIMIASYELNRTGILNRPIYVPPTTGLQGAR